MKRPFFGLWCEANARSERFCVRFEPLEYRRARFGIGKEKLRQPSLLLE